MVPYRISLEGNLAQNALDYLILAGEQAQVAVRAVQLLSKHRVVSEADLTFTGENQDDKFANQLAVGDVERTYADVTKAVKELGYDPRTKIEDGLARFVAWLRKQ